MSTWKDLSAFRIGTALGISVGSPVWSLKENNNMKIRNSLRMKETKIILVVILGKINLVTAHNKNAKI